MNKRTTTIRAAELSCSVDAMSARSSNKLWTYSPNVRRKEHAIIPLFTEQPAALSKQLSAYIGTAGGSGPQVQGMAAGPSPEKRIIRERGSVGRNTQEPEVNRTEKDSKKETNSQTHPVMQPPARGNGNFSSTNTICAHRQDRHAQRGTRISWNFSERTQGTINNPTNLAADLRWLGGEWGMGVWSFMLVVGALATNVRWDGRLSLLVVERVWTMRLARVTRTRRRWMIIWRLVPGRRWHGVRGPLIRVCLL
jgi:hypothetical protein